MRLAVFCPLSTQPVFFQGQAQIGATIQVFDAGTLTPRKAYRDGLLNNAWAQPILSDGNGCIPEIWVQGNPYKVRITSSGGVQIREVDNIPGDVAAGGGGGGGGAGQLVTGDYVDNHGTAVIAGRVRANGKTIGNAASGATELASSTCQALFQWLWNGDSNLAVSGGRGASALADWNANKTIALPDLNARSRFGIDGMGASATLRLTGATFLSGNATTLGSSGGTAAETLGINQIASHTHTGTTQASTAHSHSFTTASAGSHNHTGTTDTQGSHSHSGSTASAGAHTHSFTTGFAGSHNHTGITNFENQNFQVSGVVTSVSRSFGFVNGGSLGGFSYVSDVTYTTGSSGNQTVTHTHNISTDGNHSHGGTTDSGGAHTHTISTDGAHLHNITSDGAHVHTGSTDAGGVHTHSFTSDATGGGASHNNMTPFLLITTYIVL